MYTEHYLQTLTIKFPSFLTDCTGCLDESWFRFNVDNMHTLSTDSLFNLESLELNVQGQFSSSQRGFMLTPSFFTR